jgi:hypothetical protein
MTPGSPLSLIQRRGLLVREFLLLDDRVEVRERLPLVSSEARVPLARIAEEPVQIATRSRGLLAAAIGATALGSAVALFFPQWIGGVALGAAGALAAVLWILFLRGWRRQLVYPAAEVDLNFFADPGHRAELDPFLESLFERRRQVLAGDVERESAEGPADDLERWSWLHEQGYLTDEELGLLEERFGQGSVDSGDTVH